MSSLNYDIEIENELRSSFKKWCNQAEISYEDSVINLTGGNQFVMSMILMDMCESFDFSFSINEKEVFNDFKTVSDIYTYITKNKG
jgi:acyl carrier protein